MSDLPFEIVRDILLNLPAKSLLRFKSVCKLWYEMINDPNFMKLHYEQSNLHIVFRNPTFHICDFDTFDNAVELDYPFKYLDNGYDKDSFLKGVHEWGSSCGLFCFTMDYCCPYTIILYNPTTRTHKNLPFLAIEPPFHADRLNYLGFGYDHVSDDYKCVRILQDDEGSFSSQVMVYSLRTDSWRRGAQDVPRFFQCHYEYYIDFKGILHWSAEGDSRTLPPIVTFNLSDETFSSVSLPNYDTEVYTFSHIGVLDDCLCLMLNDLHHCDVWIMKEYSVTTSWTRLFRLANKLNNFDLSPISFINRRKQLLVSYSSFKVFTVDLETLKITDFKLPGYRRIWTAYVCPENLLMFKDAENGLGGIRQVWKKSAKRQRVMRLANRSLQQFASMLEEYEQPHSSNAGSLS